MLHQTKKYSTVLVILAAFCISAGIPEHMLAKSSGTTTSSQTTTQQAPDPLARLRQALSTAGATALSTDQETALTTLITDFRASNELTASTARLAYDNYILAGDEDSAIALIPTLQAEQADEAAARAEAVTSFGADVVRVLSTSQITSIQVSLGTDELVKLLQSLVGGFGHGGSALN
jgi:hypothetical protein